MNPWETQLRKGLVDLAVLATIARGETYGYRIVEQLGVLDGLAFTESTVYPVLTRLARRNGGDPDGALTGRPAEAVLSIDDGWRAALPPDGGELEDDFPIPLRVTRRSAVMMTTAVALELPGSLQALVDSRLDTIDRMLMGRVPRQDRLSIVREVESQVFELLQEGDGGDLGREDVLAVLARLDPPEAYLPEETEVQPMSPRRASRPDAPQPARKGDPKVAKVSGIIGLATLAVVLLSPVDYLLAIAFQSEALLLILGGGTLFLALGGSLLAMLTAAYSRLGSVWAVVGLVTSGVSLLGAIALPLILFAFNLV